MTTAAYRDGILAADTRVSYGSFHNGNMNKIHVVPMRKGPDCVENVMVVMAGVCWAIQPMIEWIESGASQDDIPHILLHRCKDFSCLMVTSNGTLFEFNEGYFIECGVEYHAIGSGSQFALGAMAADIPAPEAVKAAMKHDNATGGSIMVMTVADLTCLKEAA